MQLLDHVSITVTDLDQARLFYDGIMAALGCLKVYDRADALGYGERCREEHPHETYLAVYLSSTLTPDSGRHWCFKAASRAQVDAFHKAGLDCGGSCGGPPGLRTHYHSAYYAAFVEDPSGNRCEVVCHESEPVVDKV